VNRGYSELNSGKHSLKCFPSYIIIIICNHTLQIIALSDVQSSGDKLIVKKFVVKGA